MSEIIYVTTVEPLDRLWIRATFTDGAVKDIDLGEPLAAGGVFAPMQRQRATEDALVELHGFRALPAKPM